MLHAVLPLTLSIRDFLRFTHTLAAHYDSKRLGCTDGGAPGLANARAVLRGHPGARENGLALAEQIGLLLAGSLLRRQPLQRLCIRAGGVLHLNTSCRLQGNL